MERKQKKSRKARMPREEESKCSKQDDEREEQDRLQRRNKLLADAVDHFDRLGVSDKLVEFRRRYVQLLDDAVDAGRDAEEHTLEQTELFQRYMDMVEQELTEFIERRRCTLADFYSDCRDALEDKYCALFEDHEHKWFVELLVSMTNFQEFHQMMVRDARSSRK